MLRFQPSPPRRVWARGLDDLGRDPSGPVMGLYCVFSQVIRGNASLVGRFKAACQSLDLDPAQGLGLAIRLATRPAPQRANVVPVAVRGAHDALATPFADEEAFVICRDLLADDRMDALLRRSSLTYGKLATALEEATELLEVGDDPREPW